MYGFNKHFQESLITDVKNKQAKGNSEIAECLNLYFTSVYSQKGNEALARLQGTSN